MVPDKTRNFQLEKSLRLDALYIIRYSNTLLVVQPKILLVIFAFSRSVKLPLNLVFSDRDPVKIALF